MFKRRVAARRGRSGAAVGCVREGRVRRAPHKAAASVYPQPPLPVCSGSLAPPTSNGGDEQEERKAEVLQVGVPSSVWTAIPKGL